MTHLRAARRGRTSLESPGDLTSMWDMLGDLISNAVPGHTSLEDGMLHPWVTALGLRLRKWSSRASSAMEGK